LPPAEFFYFPFDAGPGAESAENQWGEMFVWMRTTGVLTESLTLDPSAGDLAVSPGSLTDLVIQIAVGQAWVQGFMFQHEEDYAYYDIEENSSGDPRIDLVVVELDVDNNIIEEKVVTGTPDPSPVPPTPIQNDTIWQMPLAEIAVADGATTITSMDITDVRVRSVQGDGGSSAVSLTSGTGDESLVADGVGPDLEIKAITAGPNISLTSDGDQVTIEATGAGSDVTLASAGGTETLVADGVGPDLENKGLSAGTGISLSSDASSVTITNSDPASGVTLANAGTTSLVNGGAGPALTTKGLVAGTNISFSTSSTDVTISCNTPICRVTNSSPPAITTGTTPTLLWDTNLEDPTGMHSTVSNTDRITIATTGVYHVSFSIQFSPGGTPSGNVYINVIRNRSGALVTFAGVGQAITSNQPYWWNGSCVTKLTAGDYLYVVFQNGTTQTMTPLNGNYYSPIFTVNYVGNY
jgi:hypothetical protein